MSSILIFDSGIGGLSIMQHIMQTLPDLSIHYVADYAAYPYGEKKEQWLINRINELMDSLNSTLKPDAIIIACNTASTLALPSLRRNLSTPIVGVIPAIKTASELSQNKKIGLLATPGTVSRTYMDKLIEEFATDCQITRVGSTNMVNLAEQKLSGSAPSLISLKNIIQPFIENQCDHVVLGCTHFPLLKSELAHLNTGITFIDSGTAIANRTQYILKAIPAHPNTKEMAFYTTKKIVPSLKNHLITMGFHSFNNI
ncbi:MAG: glutamate racemase [Bermanella sp.]